MPTERHYYAHVITQAETGLPWINPESAAGKPDNIGASVFLKSIETSRFLIGKDFGFNFPPDKLIEWAQILLWHKHAVGDAGWYTFRFTKGDGTTIKAWSKDVSAGLAFGWTSLWLYESAHDPHLFGADFNDPGLQVEIQCEELFESTLEVHIDSFVIVVLGGKPDHLSAMGVH